MILMTGSGDDPPLLQNHPLPQQQQHAEKNAHASTRVDARCETKVL
jgi:hypothetical protein